MARSFRGDARTWGAVFLALATLSLVVVRAVPARAAYSNTFSETFSSTTWYQNWGLSSAPGNTERLNELGGNKFLRVEFHTGSHYGAAPAWWKYTGTADEVQLTYRIRLSADWEQNISHVKLPGFGDVEYDGPSCAAACGGVPANGSNGYSARSARRAETGRMVFYVYHADMPQTPPCPCYGEGWEWDFVLLPGVWYTFREYVKLNTPGSPQGAHDGILKAWVNNVPVYTNTEIRFRDVDSIHAGGAWMIFYHGGQNTAPANVEADIDDVLVEW